MRHLLSAIVFAMSIFAATWIMKRSVPPLAQTVVTASDGRRLQLEAISASVFRFTLLDVANPVVTELRLIAKDASHVASFRPTQNGFLTSELEVSVNQTNLCMSVFDRGFRTVLSEVCPDPSMHGLLIKAPQMTHAYGLGEHFVSQPGLSWVGQVRTPGQAMGNKMVGFEKGFVGDAQYPVLYALGQGEISFGLVYDNPFAQTWNLKNQPWAVTAGGGPVSGYVIAGSGLPDIRRQFMEMSGRPPVPPWKAFGLWVSEYGFDNWQEVESKLKTLREHDFPIDGFVLDLQWFGFIEQGSESSPMGGLEWDLVRFPDPAHRIAEFKKQGIGLIAIEEPFISRALKDRQTGKVIHSVLDERGFLAKDGAEPSSQATRLDPKAWWGNGGLLDYSSRAAGDYWHDWKRQPLVDIGLVGHWTDLGEPEYFESQSIYNHGRFHHAQVHNLYNRFWSESIARGYERNRVKQRPWILSRSGTIGSQRFGAALWSGDIGSNLESLAAHVRASGHMTLSGQDYFGSDTGGFHRTALRGQLNEMFTQWFANAALFDFPLRTHTLNICNCNETAPDRVGDRLSNRENLWLRERLKPYYYSLGHVAYREGEPVVAPLVYGFSGDMNVRELADHKLIGPFLLAVSVARENATTTNVYLPRGDWFDFRSGSKIESAGQWLKGVPVRRNGRFELPIYAQAGAIVPMLGRGPNEAAIRVFPGSKQSMFTWFEDDGVSIDYQHGSLRQTRLQLTAESNSQELVIGAARGTYKGALEQRSYRVSLASEGRQVRRVTLNGTELKPRSDREELVHGAAWHSDGKLLEILTPTVDVQAQQRLLVEFGTP